MKPNSGDTETVVRHHLQAFLEQQGLDAILNDYADDACFLSEGRKSWPDKARLAKNSLNR